MYVEKTGNELCVALDAYCGLIVVDMQEDFMDGGALAVTGGRRLIEPINRMVNLFDKKGLPIFFTRDWHPKDHCSFKDYGGMWPVHCVKNTKGAMFASGLFVPSSAYVVSKATDREQEAYSGFKGTDLYTMIKEKDVKRIFVTGLATEYCVFETVKDAINLGLDTFVITDCILGVDEKKANEALNRMEQLGAKLLKGLHLA